MPDATPTSTETPAPSRRNRYVAAAQLLLAAVVLIFVGEALVGYWQDYRDQPMHVDLRWPWIIASGVVVLATYAVLIETWRRILGAWRATVRFSDAARIWFVSNLGTYVPGKVWQILAMAKLAERVKIPPAAAASSSIVNVGVNIAVGIAVAVVAGFRGLDQVLKGRGYVGIALSVVAGISILLLPVIMPYVTSTARRVTGRKIELGPLPPRAVYIAIGGNIVAWVLYGWAFQLLVTGVLGQAKGSLSDYVAAYALSYVIGYLVIFLPAGAVVRESVQTAALSALVGMNPKDAALVAVVSRLWLTVLQVGPALLYVGRGINLRSLTSRDGPNS